MQTGAQTHNTSLAHRKSLKLAAEAKLGFNNDASVGGKGESTSSSGLESSNKEQMKNSEMTTKLEAWPPTLLSKLTSVSLRKAIAETCLQQLLPN